MIEKTDLLYIIIKSYFLLPTFEKQNGSYLVLIPKNYL